MSKRSRSSNKTNTCHMPLVELPLLELVLLIKSLRSSTIRRSADSASVYHNPKSQESPSWSGSEFLTWSPCPFCTWSLRSRRWWCPSVSGAFIESSSTARGLWVKEQESRSRSSRKFGVEIAGVSPVDAHQPLANILVASAMEEGPISPGTPGTKFQKFHPNWPRYRFWEFAHSSGRYLCAWSFQNITIMCACAQST